MKMLLVNTDMFSANDLILFIESLEEITRIRNLKRQRKQMIRAQNMPGALLSSKSFVTKISSNSSSEEALMEIKEKQDNWKMGNQYFNDLIVTPKSPAALHAAKHVNILTSSDALMESFEEDPTNCNTTFILDNQYSMANQTEHYYKEISEDTLSYHEVLYKLPHDCCSYIKWNNYDYDSLKSFSHEYDELENIVERTKSKRKLSFLGYVCKKYKKCFSNNNNWDKSDSWTKVAVR